MEGEVGVGIMAATTKLADSRELGSGHHGLLL